MMLLLAVTEKDEGRSGFSALSTNRYLFMLMLVLTILVVILTATRGSCRRESLLLLLRYRCQIVGNHLIIHLVELDIVSAKTLASAYPYRWIHRLYFYHDIYIVQLGKKPTSNSFFTALAPRNALDDSSSIVGVIGDTPAAAVVDALLRLAEDIRNARMKIMIHKGTWNRTLSQCVQLTRSDASNCVGIEVRYY
jgi:hypothetical protein